TASRASSRSIDLGERRVLRARTIDRELARDAVRLLRREVPDARFGFESGRRFGYEPGDLLTDGLADVPALHVGSAGGPAGAHDPALQVGSADELAGADDHVKILLRHRERDTDEVAAAATALIGDVLTVTHSSQPGARLIEISGPGVSKASMLVEVCAELDVP